MDDPSTTLDAAFWITCGVILCLLVLSGFFSGSETALTAASRGKLHAMAAYETELRNAPHPRSLDALRTRASHWGTFVGAAAAEPFALLREIR